jgi:hypothetical protein
MKEKRYEYPMKANEKKNSARMRYWIWSAMKAVCDLKAKIMIKKSTSGMIKIEISNA